MRKAEYEFNEEMDESKIRDALEDINRRITAFEAEQAAELEENESDDSQEIRWPSLMPKED